MYWTDSDGKGVTVAPEGADEVGHIFPPADVQEKDENSIYHYYKEAIAVRNRHPEIARGTAEPLGQDFPEHTGAMKMTWEDRSCIIVCNNGKNAAHIDLRKCLGEGEYRMTDMLMTGEQKAGLTDGILALPEAGIAVLEKG